MLTHEGRRLETNRAVTQSRALSATSYNPNVLSQFLFLHSSSINAHRLLVNSPSVFDPTCDVATIRVVVCPVDDATLLVPHVLAIETHAIAFL